LQSRFESWFDQEGEKEREIRALAQRLLNRTEWDWMQANSKGGKAISMGWHPESGFIERNWDGYNEGMALYLLALGSRSHLAKEGTFEAWTAPFPKYWRGEGPNRFSPLRRTLRINMGPCRLTIAASMMRPRARPGLTISRIPAAPPMRSATMLSPTLWVGMVILKTSGTQRLRWTR